MMRIFFSDETGFLGEPMEREDVPRVGDVVYHPLGGFKVIAVAWWMWGDKTVSLLVERAKDELCDRLATLPQQPLRPQK